MTLTLPTKFKTILNKSPRYEAETLRLITDFSDWVKDNSLEFFPEYTDHGIDHIQSVLNTAETIINTSSWDILTPEDVFVLISAILLHDSAMHIDKYGLWSLLTSDRFNGVVLGNKVDETWLEKWEDFNKSVLRFDETDWYSFFGKYEVIELPKINDTNLDDRQKVVIGDFIRQYHADIAQVIASYGIPCKDNHFDIFNSEFTSLNQLSGFIAKSHNYSLREMVDELGGDQNAREYRKTHPAFLMGILRIADYLQFEENRTPKILFNIKGRGMCSPISLHEWEKHLSILSSTQNNSDAELLFVEALPNDAYTLESIKKLFKGFQNELDSFWAVNGEIYSRYPSLSAIGITLRRIKSNIDNSINYIEQNHKSFYPEVLNIKSDNQKILPLLVGPLYSDTPQIGLRELIQNSVDACNERYSAEIQEEVNKKVIPYPISITINMDDNTLTIEDNGIGMDIDTVKDYFLKIGASYRYSEVWKATHSNENSSYVPRTGKFGIGMLAGFLIGTEISVQSKKEGLARDKAVTFMYKINSTDIQVDFTEQIETGTKIKILSDQKRLQAIVQGLNGKTKDKYYPRVNKSSFWYFLDTPIINIEIIEDGSIRREQNKDVIKKEELLSNWNTVADTRLEGFYWKYSSMRDRKLYCNGILIKNFDTPSFNINFGLDSVSLEYIDICIYDNMGQFPLNLTRDGLVTKDFFEIDKLRDSIYSHYFQKIKKIIKSTSWSQEKILIQLNYYFPLYSYNTTLPFVFWKNEILPISDFKLTDKYVFFDFLLSGQSRGIIYKKDIFSLINNYAYGCIYEASKESNITKSAIANFVLNKTADSKYNYRLDNLEIDTKLYLDGWVFVKVFDYNKLSSDDIDKLIELGIIVTKINSDWIVISTEENKEYIPKVGYQVINSEGLTSYIFAICKFNASSHTEFSIMWDKYVLADQEDNVDNL